MTCAEARQAMLVADMAELRAGGSSDLSIHLGDCARCAALARALAGDLGHLSSRLARRARRRAMTLAALPIAAVLVAAVAVATKRARQTEAIVTPRTDRPASIVSVRVGAGQQAAVIRTADPKVTLVWISTGSN